MHLPQFSSRAGKAETLGGREAGSLANLLVASSVIIGTLIALIATSWMVKYFPRALPQTSHRDADVGGRPRLLPVGAARQERWRQRKLIPKLFEASSDGFSLVVGAVLSLPSVRRGPPWRPEGGRRRAAR